MAEKVNIPIDAQYFKATRMDPVSLAAVSGDTRWGRGTQLPVREIPNSLRMVKGSTQIFDFLEEKQKREITQKNVPLSFDLSHELKRIKTARTIEQLKLAHDGFLNNAEFWAKEYIAGIPATNYYWEVEETNGSVRLFHPSFGYLDVATRNAWEDPQRANIPDFERQRNLIEDKVITPEFYRLIHEGTVGDVFVWSSPPPEGVIGKGGYGGYTMTHLYELVEENGRKRIKGQDVKNLVGLRDQKELLEELSGRELFEQQEPNSLQVLGTIVKTKSSVTFYEIEKKIQQRDRLSKWVSGDSLIDFTILLSGYDSLLEEVFTHMRHGQDKVALQKFKRWAETIEKEWNKPQSYENNSSQRNAKTKGNDKSEESRIDYYAAQSRSNSESGGSCGSGIGMSEEGSEGGNSIGSSQLGGLQGASYKDMSEGNSSEPCSEIKCRECSWSPSESELKDIQNGKLTACPDCGWKPG